MTTTASPSDLVVAVSGESPIDLFVNSIFDTIAKKPKSKEEALALFKYLLKSEVEPLIEKIVEKCIERLPEPEQAIARVVASGADKAVEIVGAAIGMTGKWCCR
jgi:transcription antitermination factor NusA-like protein